MKDNSLVSSLVRIHYCKIGSCQRYFLLLASMLCAEVHLMELYRSFLIWESTFFCIYVYAQHSWYSDALRTTWASPDALWALCGSLAHSRWYEYGQVSQRIRVPGDLHAWQNSWFVVVFQKHIILTVFEWCHKMWAISKSTSHSYSFALKSLMRIFFHRQPLARKLCRSRREVFEVSLRYNSRPWLRWSKAKSTYTLNTVLWHSRSWIPITNALGFQLRLLCIHSGDRATSHLNSSVTLPILWIFTKMTSSTKWGWTKPNFS